MKYSIIALFVLSSFPVWASEKCMWLYKQPTTSFEQTIKLERIKQDMRNRKISYSKMSEKDILKFAETMYCEK